MVSQNLWAELDHSPNIITRLLDGDLALGLQVQADLSLSSCSVSEGFERTVENCSLHYVLHTGVKKSMFTNVTVFDYAGPSSATLRADRKAIADRWALKKCEPSYHKLRSVPGVQVLVDEKTYALRPAALTRERNHHAF